MTRLTARARRTGPRSNRGIGHRAAARSTVTIPAQQQATADAYTWAVNAAVESGDTELAYELARSYQNEA